MPEFSLFHSLLCCGFPDLKSGKVSIMSADAQQASAGIMVTKWDLQRV